MVGVWCVALVDTICAITTYCSIENSTVATGRAATIDRLSPAPCTHASRCTRGSQRACSASSASVFRSLRKTCCRRYTTAATIR